MAGSSMLFSLLGKDVSASKTVKGLRTELGKASKDGEKFGKKFGASLKVGAAAAGTAIAALAVSSVKANAEDEQGQAVLAKALKNSTGARDSDIASVEEWISKTTLASGVADDDLRPALASLARATGNTSEAQGLLSTAMDVSAATGKPLQSVAIALAKAHDGNTAALSRLVPGMKDASGKALPFKDAMVKLNAQFGGSQAAKQDTAAGKFQILTNRWQEGKETIGGYLLPALMGLFGLISDHTTAVVVLAAVFGALALTVGVVSAVSAAYGAIVAIVTAVTTAWKMAQFALNVALMANPIGLIILAIVALVAGIVIAYKKSETFRRIVTGAFHAVQAAVSAAWNWIKGHWPLLLAILTGPIGLAVLAIKDHKDKILGFFKAIPGKITGFFSGLVDVLTAPFRAGFNAIADLWNSTIGGFGIHIPKIGPFGGTDLTIPNMPHLAKGGIITGPTVALLGEGRYSEAVVPLDGRHGLGGGPTVVVQAQIIRSDRELEDVIISALQTAKNRGRPIPRTA